MQDIYQAWDWLSHGGLQQERGGSLGEDGIVVEATSVGGASMMKEVTSNIEFRDGDEINISNKEEVATTLGIIYINMGAGWGAKADWEGEGWINKKSVVMPRNKKHFQKILHDEQCKDIDWQGRNTDTLCRRTITKKYVFYYMKEKFITFMNR